MLRQHGAMQGQLMRRVAVQVALLQPHRAAAGAQVAGDQPQQRRLAGAVRPDDRDRLAGLDAQIDLVDQRGAADHDRNRADLEQGGHSATSPRWRSSM